MGLFKKNCYTYPKNCTTNYKIPAPAPNPNPARWELLSYTQFKKAYVLKVRYLDCTNFEGVKILVFKGKYRPRKHMDPHFGESRWSPIARFKPDSEGETLAFAFAENIA